ncbi:flagellar biosynthesis protein FlhF [Clostridium acetireducens DSM 10703]|jgi:flagellar biosynthesis protein FlhF|uniref:Flagellar biosynthesis protein FlhF n=1 Tax=Clostridium acetireducens DSM 10703 TaxID=1121290 RepID=A0A1E8F066_9CLOT|nr:flagellar biosynthesis protein FlhF [Clostridium acetireducens]OFI06822.1 flagellar biosynthesis protein FlhF [Clostridium acetireducens DSM 10703]
MIIRKYIVKNMNEAMTKIKRDMGKDAIIVSQRRIRKPGFLGFFSKKKLEVTAAIDNTKKEEFTSSGVELFKKVMEKQKSIDKTDEKYKNEELSGIYEVAAEKEKQETSSAILNQIEEMKKMIDDVKKITQNTTANKSEIEIKLENSDLIPDLVNNILSNMNLMEENIEDTQKAKKVIQNMVPDYSLKIEGPMVLVGPTGVGKTTTIAKLAGKLALIQRKKVGLITIDTYRIGAVEQLRTYADIMNIPFKVVFSIKEMEEAVHSMENCDIILIDTTGRSSKNTMQISELRAFIEKIPTKNINLVISATTKNKDINTILEGYKELKYNYVIITKLDETTTYGSILNIINISKKPISFITTGQNVPDDLRKINAEEIANLILGECSI